MCLSGFIGCDRNLYFFFYYLTDCRIFHGVEQGKEEVNTEKYM